MPTISVNRESLFRELGRKYTDEEFDELCFEFGIELDEVTSEREIAEKERGEGAVSESLSDQTIYRIDVPANRYDLLCLEGLSRALNVFLRRIPAPEFRLSTPAEPLRMVVKRETNEVRPYVVCAVIRNITFTPESYQSFIDLQEKLHQNICRKRTLVAIGTHDLDTVRGPFTYEAQLPSDIRFRPLSQAREFRADELMEFYRTDATVKHIKPYVDIIADKPRFPVIYDANRTVLSLPPIINGEHSKITLATRNVFFECTATDLTKANVVLNTMVTMFAGYADTPFVVEPVIVEYEDAAQNPGYITPELAARTVEASVDRINSVIGINITAAQAADFATRMQLSATVVEARDLPEAAGGGGAGGAAGGAGASSPSSSSSSGARAVHGGTIRCQVPVTRSDILHECDIAEDVAIAFGYNNVVRTLPKTLTVGRQQPVNHLTDQLRAEIAMAGYSESLTMALLSTEENYAFCQREDDGRAVVLANPKTIEFQIARTSLLPGLLKVLQSNQDISFKAGVKIFEISDVLFLDSAVDTGARNERHVAAVYAGPTAGFEIIHGLVNRLMLLLEVPLVLMDPATGSPLPTRWGRGNLRYYVAAGDDPIFFPGRSAKIVLERKTADNDDAPVITLTVGQFGIVHPKVLENFEISEYPASALEFNLEHFVLDK